MAKSSKAPAKKANVAVTRAVARGKAEGPAVHAKAPAIAAKPAPAARAAPLVEMRDMSIAFGGIKAVDHASIDLYPGEVVGLLGHNGAGKSTLIKILSGAYKRDHGEIFINGDKVAIDNPRDA